MTGVLKAPLLCGVSPMPILKSVKRTALTKRWYNKKSIRKDAFLMEVESGFEPLYKVLQTSA